MITIDRKAAAKRIDDAEKVPIFELDGTTYSIPRVERSEIALRYLEIANDESEDRANYYLLTTMLGQDGYDALKSVDGLEASDFERITALVSDTVMPKSNPKGRRG